MPGDRVEVGDPLGEVHAADADGLAEGARDPGAKPFPWFRIPQAFGPRSSRGSDRSE